jgi:hypothetical protein
MKSKACGIFLLCAVLLVFSSPQAGAQERGAGFYVEETGEGFRFVQRFSWEHEEYASFYEVTIQREESAGTWNTSFSEFTQDSYIEISLPPGSYRYRVRAYDLMENPAGNPAWQSFEILPALRPVLENFSPESFALDVPDKGAALILTVRGLNLTEQAEFRLVREGSARPQKLLPLERRGGASGKEAVLVFDAGQLSPGTYELSVVNPGGLSDSLGTLRIYLSKTMPRFAVSAGYGPLLSIYGGLSELLDDSFFPAGAYGQFSFLPLQTGSAGFGMEADLFWTRISSPYTNNVQDYDVSGHYAGLEVYGFVQKPLTSRVSAKLRLGGGLFSVIGFEKKAPGSQAGAVNALIPAAGGGLSFRLVFFKSFFVDLGAEYTHFFSADESPPGYVRPFAGIGVFW